MQLTADGRISRAELDETFCIDHNRRRVLEERRQRKVARRLRKKVIRQRGISFPEYVDGIIQAVAKTMHLPARLIRRGKSNYTRP